MSPRTKGKIRRFQLVGCHLDALSNLESSLGGHPLVEGRDRSEEMLLRDGFAIHEITANLSEDTHSLE